MAAGSFGGSLTGTGELRSLGSHGRVVFLLRYPLVPGVERKHHTHKWGNFVFGARGRDTQKENTSMLLLFGGAGGKV